MFYLVTTNGNHWSVSELEKESISTIPYEKHGTLYCEVRADTEEDALKTAKAKIIVDAIQYCGTKLNGIATLVNELKSRGVSNKEAIRLKGNGSLEWLESQLKELIDD